MIPDYRFRIADRMVEAFSVLVPGNTRSEWKDEWRAEIAYHRAKLERNGRFDSGPQIALILRCMGALIHALWLRKQEWRLEMFLQDLLYGLRMLWKKPVFSAVAIIVLALGIGANTAIFSVVYSVLLRPLPFKDPDKLLMLFSQNQRMDAPYNQVSFDDLGDFTRQNEVFEQIAGVSVKWSFSLTGAGDAEQVFGNWVSANFFSILGVEPRLGRTIRAEEDRAAKAFRWRESGLRSESPGRWL